MAVRIKKILKEKKGTTLFETIVAFGLLGIFCTMMVYLITISLSTYSSVTGNADAQEVSTIIMEKISGEIAGAQAGIKSDNTLIVMDRSKYTGINGEQYLGYDSNSCISFCNKDGSLVYIYSEDGRIVIHFRPITENHLNIKAVDWTFDDKLYQNYKVDSLKFWIERNSANKKTNIIKIYMKLVNEKSGYVYETNRFVECYNFDESQISKMKYGMIGVD